MPLYEYQCDTCHTTFEVRRSFSDTGVPPCPHCNGTGQVRKVFSAPAIVFKGSGFYVTDSRSKNSNTRPAAHKDTNGAAGANGKSKEGANASKTESPAKKESSKKD